MAICQFCQRVLPSTAQMSTGSSREAQTNQEERISASVIFDDVVRECCDAAQDVAHHCGAQTLTSLHLLYAITAAPRASQHLVSIGISSDALMLACETALAAQGDLDRTDKGDALQYANADAEPVYASNEVQWILQYARETAVAERVHEVTLNHLLLGYLALPEDAWARHILSQQISEISARNNAHFNTPENHWLLQSERTATTQPTGVLSQQNLRQGNFAENDMRRSAAKTHERPSSNLYKTSRTTGRHQSRDNRSDAINARLDGDDYERRLALLETALSRLVASRTNHSASLTADGGFHQSMSSQRNSHTSSSDSLGRNACEPSQHGSERYRKDDPSRFRRLLSRLRRSQRRHLKNRARAWQQRSRRSRTSSAKNSWRASEATSHLAATPTLATKSRSRTNSQRNTASRSPHKSQSSRSSSKQKVQTSRSVGSRETKRETITARKYPTRPTYDNEFRTEKHADGQATSSSSSQDESKTKFYLSIDDPVVEAPSIGPKTATRLNKIDVYTVRDLLECEVIASAEKLNSRHISSEVLKDWQDQARLVCVIPHLRGTHAQLFVGAGFRDVEAITSVDASTIMSRILKFAGTSKGQSVLRSGEPPEMEKVVAWANNATKAEVSRAA